MNDKPAGTTATTFDPAANGWEAITKHTAFGDLVGPVWRTDQDGVPRFGFTVAPKHLNRAGNLHGGMLMTLADQSMAMTARVASGGKPHATLELNIQFVGGVKLGEFVVSHPEVVRVTRSVVFMRATMFVGNRVVVTTNAIWKILGEG
jgi:uncharacterized protein (TIGR00369 family)